MAEYWHMGETTMRFATSRLRIRKGEKRGLRRSIAFMARLSGNAHDKAVARESDGQTTLP
jgi:hypothetical protein